MADRVDSILVYVILTRISESGLAARGGHLRGLPHDALSCRMECGFGPSGLRPDLQGAEGAAILQVTRILPGKAHPLTSTQLAVTTGRDAGEVHEAIPGHLRRDDHAPALVSIEPLDHASHTALRERTLLRHPPILSPARQILATSIAADRAIRSDW